MNILDKLTENAKNEQAAASDSKKWNAIRAAMVAELRGMGLTNVQAILADAEKLTPNKNGIIVELAPIKSALKLLETEARQPAQAARFAKHADIMAEANRLSRISNSDGNSPYGA